MPNYNFHRETIRYHLTLASAIFSRRERPPKDARWPQRQWILGHRGARANAPENTIASFRLAMDLNADGVEFDVVPSRDGVPVVIHDETLERTTNGTGIVWHHHSDELFTLDATKLKPGFPKEGIPSLRDALSCLPDNALVNIELKDRGHLSPDEFVDVIERVINPEAQRLRIVLSSFDGTLLKILRERKTPFLLAIVLSRFDAGWHQALQLMPTIKPDAIHVTPDLATPCARLLTKLARMRMAIWTINDPESVVQWFACGIDGIFTDCVAEIVNRVRPRRQNQR